MAGPHARAALALAGGVAIIAALSLAGSVLLAATANGIAVFMLFGAGLTAGLLGQIAEALGSDTLDNVADVASWALPFEALYQSGSGSSPPTPSASPAWPSTSGRSAARSRAGPSSGSGRSSTVVVGIAATAAFARRDL